MVGKRLWIAILCVIMLAGLLAAQDEKNELSGSFGRTFISTQAIQGANFFDPNIRYGKGIDLAGSYARLLFLNPLLSVAAEVPVVFNVDEDLHAGGPGNVPGDLKMLFVTPSVRVNLFPTTAVSPWGSLGGGMEHITQSTTTLYDNPNPGGSTTSGVLQYGVGLDVKLTKKIRLRGEGRDFWAGEPDFPLAPTGKTRQHNYFVGLGVLWRF
jgi:opacity protein-like surface antigen